MSTDPICGMTVSEASVWRVERDGQSFYFCGEPCRQKFLSAPATTEHEETPHAGGLPSPAAPEPSDRSTALGATSYICPMCPGVKADKPGACPTCGMAPERKAAWLVPASSHTLYTCPMHPEVQQDHPGHCPKCGMALELKTVTASTDAEENAELHDMTKRFWIGAALTLPVLVVAMAHMVPILGRQPWMESHLSRVFAFLYNALGIPVVAGGLYPFFGLLLSRSWPGLQ